MISALMAMAALLADTYLFSPIRPGSTVLTQVFTNGADADIPTHLVRDAIASGAGYLVLGSLLGVCLGALGALGAAVGREFISVKTRA